MTSKEKRLNFTPFSGKTSKGLVVNSVFLDGIPDFEIMFLVLKSSSLAVVFRNEL